MPKLARAGSTRFCLIQKLAVSTLRHLTLRLTRLLGPLLLAYATYLFRATEKLIVFGVDSCNDLGVYC
jgi:hypothetical protein